MYKEFKVNLSDAQAKKVLDGKPVRLTAGQLGTGDSHYFHPENYKKLVRAYENNRGLTLHMSRGAVLRTHQSGLTGSGFWDRLWKGVKKGASSGWTFLKNNWKPLATAGMDAIAKAQPEAAPLRGLIKSATGLGLEPEQPVATHIPTRRRKLKGGSFRIG